MNNKNSFGTQNKNRCAPTAVIVAAMLLSFSVKASATMPQNEVNGGQEKERVSLKLSDVDICIFIETVAQLSGKNIIVDPRVKAQVTYVSDVPLDATQLYNVFLSLLDVHDLTVIDVNHTTIMVVPNDTIVLDSVVRNWSTVL